MLWFYLVQACFDWAVFIRPARISTKLMMVTLQVYGDEIKTRFFPFYAEVFL
jgi:hypothetical protein